MRLLPLASALCASLSVLGCSSPAPRDPASEAPAASPLGPSFVLQPAPSDDDALLGRILTGPPEPGRSLEDLSQPNRCVDKLAPPKTSAMVNVFDNAEDVSTRAKAGATFSMFGFGADAQRATHLAYRLSTSRQVARTDTAEYVACCREKSCGYGYVAALVYGEGEYSAGEETTVKGEANLTLATAEGETRLRVLRRRSVKGWVAALVRVTDEAARARALDPLGGLMAKTGVDLGSLPVQARELYEREKVTFSGGRFSTGGGAIGQDEFVRRYANITGAHDLDGYRAHRDWTRVYFWGGLFLGSAAVTVWAYSRRPWARPQFGDGQHSLFQGQGICGELACTVAWVAVPLTLGLGVQTLRAWLADDTSMARLGTYEATLAVRRYNRDLLRRSFEDLKRQGGRAEPPRWDVYVGLGGAGVGGTF